MADAPRGATAPISSAALAALPNTSYTTGMHPEARRHYCSRCGHSGDYAGTGPHTCPGCECELAPVRSWHAPMLPADLAQSCTTDTESAESALAGRLTDLHIESVEVAALVSIAVVEFDTREVLPDFYRKRALTLLYLAEKMSERLALVLGDGSLLNLAAAGRKTEGGAA